MKENVSGCFFWTQCTLCGSDQMVDCSRQLVPSNNNASCSVAILWFTSIVAFVALACMCVWYVMTSTFLCLCSVMHVCLLQCWVTWNMTLMTQQLLLSLILIFTVFHAMKCQRKMSFLVCLPVFDTLWLGFQWCLSDLVLRVIWLGKHQVYHLYQNLSSKCAFWVICQSAWKLLWRITGG